MDKPDENPSSSDDEKSPNDYAVYCSLCKTGFAGTVPYRQHLKGSKHQKAETKQYMKEKYGRKYLEAVKELENGKLDDTKIDESATTSASDTAAPATVDGEVYTCLVCKKVCTGHLPYQLHLKSHKHAKQVRKQELISKMKDINGSIGEASTKDESNILYETVPQLKPFASCNVCNKTFSGVEGYQQHLDSDVHKKELQKHKVLEDMTRDGVTFKEDPDENGFVTCTECNKSFSGPIPYQQHLLSDVHKNKAKDLDLAQKVAHMMTTDEEGYIQCSECGKLFSGPKPLYQHLKGSAHSKQKKRDDLIKDLVAKFPEFLMESEVKEDEEDSDSEYLLCSICHKCFSGPENAREHFRSKKHLKAKREKARIDKLKAEKKLKRSPKKAVNASESANAMANGNADVVANNAKKVASVDPEDEFEIID